MAASFNSASSQVLQNTTPPFTSFPFSVGLWVYPTTIGALRSVWSLADTTATGNRFLVQQSAANAWVFNTTAAGSGFSITIAAAVTANQWTFLVARAVAAANRKFAVLKPDGSAAHGSNLSSLSPAGVDTMALGARVDSITPSELFSGLIAEFWCSNTDIQQDGAQLSDATLRQLAYGGPFSIPHIARDIIEYRSFRNHPDSRGDRPDEVYHGAAGRQAWINTNGVTTGPHPPLPYWYRKPGDTTRMLMA